MAKLVDNMIYRLSKPRPLFPIKLSKQWGRNPMLTALCGLGALAYTTKGEHRR